MSDIHFNDDADSVVTAIQNGVRTEEIVIEGKSYTSRKVFVPPHRPNCESLRIESLGGIVEYLNSKVDDPDDRQAMVVVVDSPTSVTLHDQVENQTDNRACRIVASYKVQTFPFGQYLAHEQFVVSAQAQLQADVGDFETLIKYVGNLTAALVKTSADDGTTQTVVVETGVRKSEIDLPNPVKLAPRRTFPEVEQPASPFVLRVRQSREGQMPEIALFEADGGLWRVEAIANIKEFLRTSLDVAVPIVG